MGPNLSKTFRLRVNTQRRWSPARCSNRFGSGGMRSHSVSIPAMRNHLHRRPNVASANMGGRFISSRCIAIGSLKWRRVPPIKLLSWLGLLNS